MDKFITVYKASAGAGKTYTLTQDYIKLILENEEAYRHVLAVTFTNKATEENFIKWPLIHHVRSSKGQEMCL